MAIVGEDRQAVASDLRIGRVGVGDVDRSARECLVRQAVVHRLDVRRRETVARGERWIAVASSEKLGAQAEAKVGGARQIGDRGEVAPRGERGRDREGVRVVETEGIAHLDAADRERAAEARQVPVARGVQNRLGERAGVLGVHVDGSLLQRPEDDRGAAEPLLVRDRAVPGGPGGLGGDLGEDVRLGEPLRSDA